MPERIERFRAQVSNFLPPVPRRSKWIEAPVVNDEDAPLLDGEHGAAST